MVENQRSHVVAAASIAPATEPAARKALSATAALRDSRPRNPANAKLSANTASVSAGA